MLFVVKKEGKRIYLIYLNKGGYYDEKMDKNLWMLGGSVEGIRDDLFAIIVGENNWGKSLRNQRWFRRDFA